MIERYGVAKLSAWTGRDRSRVHAWAWPRSRGGTGGVIPHGVRSAIIAGAAGEGESLSYADFEPVGGETYLLDGAA